MGPALHCLRSAPFSGPPNICSVARKVTRAICFNQPAQSFAYAPACVPRIRIVVVTADELLHTFQQPSAIGPREGRRSTSRQSGCFPLGVLTTRHPLGEGLVSFLPELRGSEIIQPQILHLARCLKIIAQQSGTGLALAPSRALLSLRVARHGHDGLTPPIKSATNPRSRRLRLGFCKSGSWPARR